MVIWQSFDFPTDTLLGGQNLSSGSSLISSMSGSDHSSGGFLLNLQRDGNLVAYPVNCSNGPEDSYGSTGTPSSDFSQLSLDKRGFLYLQGLIPFVLYISANGTYPGKIKTSIYRATLDTDGIFRLYVHHFDANTSSDLLNEWPALDNPCKVKGLCGINSYCLVKNNSAVCLCYPGFFSLNSSRKFLGCYWNHSEDGCRSTKDPTVLYNITSLENMWWADDPYSVVSMKVKDCGKSCQEDCDCGAVLYMNGTCNKYKLPLRYGRMIQNTSATAFFKVTSGSIMTPTPNSMVFFRSKTNLIFVLVLSLGSISCLCLVFVISSCYMYRQQVHRYGKLSGSANMGWAEERTLRSFSFDELVKSTDGFKEEIGRGSYGAVYRGTISGSNRTIAVKRLERVVDEGEREFRAEITAIARTYHRNLVQLLGYCIEGSRKLLVYEYMSNGSLADLLFKAEMRLIWKERVRIALDVARGILYLHDECEVCIIHCNIKPQNILMDDAWSAKIADFGLAKLLVPNQLRFTSRTERISGYLAPERQKDASISIKADIYSFGIVLLETVCCRSSINLNVSSEDEIILYSWVYDCILTGNIHKLVADDDDVDWNTLERMLKVGLWCVQEDPNLRPSMKNVMLMLEGLIEVPVPPSPALAIS
ncbi:S-receptor kinase-like protein [Quillaja saponaria]|uniref:non-specific serine/threonine protein kinase n=1 Tax=Quillaja saponaria TaxID=32244 RepID=A0AAD7LF18_QUISA|nr:S-receptor kinase-like protein [Quillaja saponaria]